MNEPIKAGELCYLVGMNVTPEASGMVVETVRRYIDGTIVSGFIADIGGPAWVVRGRRIPWRSSFSSRLYYVSERVVEESCLCPIRNPGEDATDEMVRIAGKPQEVTA